MKTPSKKQKRAGISIITTLVIGTIGMISTHSPARAQQVQLGKSSILAAKVCIPKYYVYPHHTFIEAFANIACPRSQVQTAILCKGGQWHGYPIGRTSRSNCAKGNYAINEASRFRETSTSPWEPWLYFPNP
jgi:hypothetical protein